MNPRQFSTHSRRLNSSTLSVTETTYPLPLVFLCHFVQAFETPFCNYRKESTLGFSLTQPWFIWTFLTEGILLPQQISAKPSPVIVTIYLINNFYQHHLYPITFFADTIYMGNLKMKKPGNNWWFWNSKRQYMRLCYHGSRAYIQRALLGLLHNPSQQPKG